MSKFTTEEIAIRYREAELRRENEAIEKAKIETERMVAWMTSAPKVDLIVVSSAAVIKTEFNEALVNLLISNSDNLSIGFFIGVMIMKDHLNEIVSLANQIKTLKDGGLQSSRTIDVLLEAIAKFC